MSRPPAEAVEGSHTRATYAGRELRVRSQNRDTVSLHDDDGPFAHVEQTLTLRSWPAEGGL